jgi:hypothetical protein
VRVRDKDNPGTYYDEVTVNVNPSGIDHFVVSGLPASYSAGSSTGIIVEAQDQFNNTKTDYAGTVTFDTNDIHASVKIPSDYQFTTSGASPDDGVHNFKMVDGDTVTLVTVGSIYVRVKGTAYGVWMGTQTVMANNWYPVRKPGPE